MSVCTIKYESSELLLAHPGVACSYRTSRARVFSILVAQPLTRPSYFLIPHEAAGAHMQTILMGC